MPQELAGQVAIVTGAARGIGHAIVQRFAAAGARVCVADRDQAGAQAVAEGLRTHGAEAIALGVDISDRTQVDALMTEVLEHFGSIDVLVNNAAHACYDFAIDLSDDDWDYTLGISLTGTFTCAQRAARQMVQQRRGHIVNITSMAARIALARTVAYAASKGAVEALTRVMAIELAEYGVQVNAIAPGPIDTEFSREVVSDEGRAQRLSRLPSGRLGTPDDVANAALFLSSPTAGWITGTVLAVDGGYTIAGAIESRAQRQTLST